MSATVAPRQSWSYRLRIRPRSALQRHDQSSPSLYQTPDAPGGDRNRGCHMLVDRYSIREFVVRSGAIGEIPRQRWHPRPRARSDSMRSIELFDYFRKRSQDSRTVLVTHWIATLLLPRRGSTDVCLG